MEGTATPPDHDRLLVVLSDIEMGHGGPADDCPHSEAIADLLLERSEAYPRTPIDFVFNGDALDFLKTPLDGKHLRHVNERMALAKLEAIALAHRAFFAKLGVLLQRPRRRAWFVVGNHDFELFFPRVQQEVRRLAGADEASVLFPGLELDIGDVHCEHGSQGDALFRIDPEHIFVDYEGEAILNLPWGAVGLIDTVLPFQSELYALDRIRPRQALFDVLPEARDLLVTATRRHWTGAHWHDLLVLEDPVKQVNFDILKEVALRLLAKNAEVSFGSHYLDLLDHDPKHRVVVVGHEHRGQILHHEGGSVVQTACLRNEYALDEATCALQLRDKGMAEIWMSGGRAVETRLIPVTTPEPPPGYMPDDIRSLRPAIVRCLESLAPASGLLPALAVALSRRWSRSGKRGRHKSNKAA